jgi:hypothetical protein
MGLCLAQNSPRLHYPLEATQQRVLGFTFTYRDLQRHNTPPHSRDIHGPIILDPCMSLRSNPALPIQSGFTIALAAVYQLITARFKGYFGVLAALGTCRGKHLASGPVAAVSATL